MQIYHQLQGLSPQDKGASCALGNFDGVHLGHQCVLDLARNYGPLGVMTFEPHPRAFFSPKDAVPFRLMNTTARAHQLEKLGVEKLYELTFDMSLAALDPRAFAHDILHHAAGVNHVVVGADFCFGKGRAGRARDLVQLGQEFGFGVTIAPLVQSGGAEISSTAIRQALQDGDPARAGVMLGHWHRIDGPVLHGAKRGGEFGYPTANMSVNGLHLPKLGIYAVLIDVLTGPHKGAYKGVASLGVLPMFGKNQPNLESFLFDFSENLYDSELSVAFIDYLRPEMVFDGLAPLLAQMANDCDQARAILATL